MSGTISPFQIQVTALKEMLGGLPPPSKTTIWLQPGSVPPFGPEKVVAKLPEKVEETTLSSTKYQTMRKYRLIFVREIFKSHL